LGGRREGVRRQESGGGIKRGVGKGKLGAIGSEEEGGVRLAGRLTEKGGSGLYRRDTQALGVSELIFKISRLSLLVYC
jgi:hypothetical protein